MCVWGGGGGGGIRGGVSGERLVGPTNIAIGSSCVSPPLDDMHITVPSALTSEKYLSMMVRASL